MVPWHLGHWRTWFGYMTPPRRRTCDDPSLMPVRYAEDGEEPRHAPAAGHERPGTLVEPVPGVEGGGLGHGRGGLLDGQRPGRQVEDPPRIAPGYGRTAGVQVRPEEPLPHLGIEDSGR